MELEHDGRIAILRMAAGKANAVGPDFLARLDGLLAELEESDARAAVITGYDRFFSAGLDLVALTALDRAAMGAFMAEFQRVYRRLYALPRPVVAAVNGHAIAGGCVLALMADERVLAAEARMGLNETRLGVGLPPVVLETLRLALPPRSWTVIALEGGIFAAERALELGLAQEVQLASRVLERARERADELADVPTRAWGQVKLGLRAPALAALAASRAAELAATHEAWLDTWFAPETRELIAAAVAKLGQKS